MRDKEMKKEIKHKFDRSENLSRRLNKNNI